MKITETIKAVPIVTPSWVFSERQRKTYQVFLYIYIRYHCRIKLGFVEHFEDARKKLENKWYDPISQKDVYSPKEIYIFALPFFYEGSELEEECDMAMDKDFPDGSCPSEKLIKAVSSGINEDDLFDVHLMENKNTWIFPFMSDRVIYLYRESYTQNDFSRVLNTLLKVASLKSTIRSVKILGLYDSSMMEIEL